MRLTVAVLFAALALPLQAQAQAPAEELGEGWTQLPGAPLRLQWQGATAAERMDVTVHAPVPALQPALAWLEAYLAQQQRTAGVEFRDCNGGYSAPAAAAVQFCTLPAERGGTLLAAFVAAESGDGDIALVEVLAAQTPATRERLLLALPRLTAFARAARPQAQ